MQKNLALIAKYFKKIYKPTNNNLRTSLNSRNNNVDTSPRYKNDYQTGQFGNQRTVTVAGARETVGGQIMQQTGIQCFNYKEFGHFAKECRKPKRVKDYTYHKEKMLLCKQAEKGVPLQAEQADLLEDTDEETDEQELEAHYNYMEKIQEHSEQPKTITNTCVVETVDSVNPDSPYMCNNAKECDEECVALANLIANLKLDIDENKKIQKQLKKENTSLTRELDKYKLDLKYCQMDLERYKNIQTNQKYKEAVELKFKEALDLLASNTHKNIESSKTKAYRTFLVKEENAYLVTQISMQER
ncbi:copia protein [Tanacetum coccineum]